MASERVVSRLVIGVAALAAAVIAWVFLSRFPLPIRLLGVHAGSLAGALGVLLASYTCGGAAVAAARAIIGRGPGLESANRGISLVDRLLVGIPIFGTLIAAIAWSGVAVRLTMMLATLALAAAAVLPVIEWTRTRDRGRVSVVSVFALLPPVVIAFLAALTPVNSPDELIYKLSVPKAWVEFGKMVELPLNSNSYFPAAIYSADLGAIVMGGGGAARLVHFVLFLLTLRVVWRLSEDVAKGSGLWSSVVFAWSPALLVIAGWCWAEWGMLGLLLLSWHRFHGFVESGRSDDLAVSALGLAGALGSKYTAGPWLLLFVPIAAILLWRNRRESAVRVLLSSAIIVALAGGFFYVRNLVWTGSPLAPFGLPDSPDVSGFRSGHGGWWELVRGYDVFHPGIIDDSLGILLPVAVLLSPLALALFGRRQAPLFVLGIVQTIWLITFSPTSRLILLGVAPLAVLGAAAGWRAVTASVPGVRRAVVACALPAMLAQLVLVLFVFTSSYEPFGVLFGAESEREYLWRLRGFEKPYAWIESSTPPESVVLMLGETRAYHLERRAHWAGNLDGPRVASWMGRAKTAGELRAQLDGLEITHVLVRRDHVVVGDSRAPTMLEKEYLLTLTPETDAVLQETLGEGAIRRYQDEVYLVYELAR